MSLKIFSFLSSYALYKLSGTAKNMPMRHMYYVEQPLDTVVAI